MKKIYSIIAFLFLFLSINAQQFVRYNMNDGTYNGFYTEEIDSITHSYENGIAETCIYAIGMIYKLPVESIDSVSFEAASIGSGDIGQYRIYEFNYDGNVPHKVYIDNRATLLASKNGDFGANDTIFFASAYRNNYGLCITDSLGRVNKCFDGTRLLFFHYGLEGQVSVIEMTETEFKELDTHYLTNRGPRKIRMDQVINVTGYMSNSFNWLAHMINDIGNNPELHNQLCIIDGLGIGVDIASLIAALGGTIESGGISIGTIRDSLGNLLNDIINLIDDIFPGNEQLRRYEDYYQNKYSVSLSALDPENITCTKATIRGKVGSTDGLRGTIYFSFNKDNEFVYIPANRLNETQNSCIVYSHETDLKPGESYFYGLEYHCVVDGLRLRFYSNNVKQFVTPSPTVYTGEPSFVEKDIAEVSCTYYNVPDDATCGVEYYWDGGKAEKKAGSNKDGEHFIRLSELQAATEYLYRAFVKFGEKYIYAKDTKTFTTKAPDIVGTWNCEEEYDWRPFPGAEWQKKTRTYTLTIKEDRTMQISGLDSEYIASSWSYSNGTFSGRGYTYADNTSTYWDEFSGTVDDIKNPHKITGSRYEGRQNAVYNGKEYMGKLIMTR